MKFSKEACAEFYEVLYPYVTEVIKKKKAANEDVTIKKENQDSNNE